MDPKPHFINLGSYGKLARLVEVVDTPELEKIGLYPSSGLSDFHLDKLHELVNFCALQKTYHIVSCYNGLMYFNLLLPWCHCFMLAKGNKDPRLAAFPEIDVNYYQKRLVDEFDRQEGFSKSANLSAIQHLILNF